MRTDGGSAFPVTIGSQSDKYLQGSGMSLRDYFAAHAPTEIPEGFAFFSGEFASERVIRWRWYYADAMLAEREKP